MTPDEPADTPGATAAPVTPASRPLLRMLGPADLEALGIWIATRIAVFVAAAMTGWLFYRTQVIGGTTVRDVVPFADRWAQWDFIHFRDVAEVWYASRPTGVPIEAFFPGFPFTLWLLHGFGLPHVVAGLVVSAVAGAVAVVALARLGDREAGPGVGNRAVLLLVLAPPAVFLAAPYTESLFLAFAIPAWLAARRGHWPAAVLLCAGASTVRVSGLFLGAALVVEFVTSPNRRWRQAPLLAVCFTTPALYMAFLWRRTGDPFAWLHAQEEGWYRTFTWPWDALGNTWDGAVNRPDFSPDYGWQFRAEIIAGIIGLLLTVGLLVWRRWGEATYVGLQVAAFMTSFWFFSIPRSTLLWWPLWIALAAVTLRWRWTLWAYVAVSAPLMIVWTAAFVAGGRWTG